MEKILILNAGSSSIKFALFDVDGGRLVDEPVIQGSISDLDSKPTFKASGLQVPEGIEATQPQGVRDHRSAWNFLVGWLVGVLGDDALKAVGHRIVHGGPDFSAPTILDEETVAHLTELTPLAPGHQPHNLAGVEVVERRWSAVPQIACFDTAFHRTQPRIEEIFALPRKLLDDGVIRYGFHGLSYEYVAGVLSEVMDDYPRRRVIVAHLGAGASMCAMVDGKSVTTTMGFTALEGLPMATRCGSVDPGVILHLIENKNMSAAEVADCLYTESGLLGLSGVSGDMRALQNSKAPEAAEAIDFFVRRVVREIGSLAAAMGGVDALVFTAGIGENSPFIREQVIRGSAWLGFALDEDANRLGEARLTIAESVPSAWTIPTNEELMIARHTFCLTAQ